MPQRPVTGSLRSPDIESVLIHVNARNAGLVPDGHDIEPAPPVEPPAAREIIHRHPPDAALLPHGDGLSAVAVLHAAARLHLDKHNHVVVARDDVNFSVLGSVTTGKNCVPAAPELGTREIFPGFSKPLPLIVCHGPCPWQATRQNRQP